MKKISIFAVLGAVFALFSCSKPEWKASFEEGRALAEKSGKFILLNFRAESDEVSEKLSEIGFGGEDFLSQYGKNFSFVEIDFTDRLKSESLNPDASEEERQNAEKIIRETQDSVALAERYGIRTLPSTFVLTQEGYVVQSLNFYKIRDDFDPNKPDAMDAPFDEIFALDDYAEICKKCDEAIVLAEDFRSNLKIARSDGKIEDRIAAIDEVFDSTDFSYRYLIRDLSALAVEIDGENVSGSIAKHQMSLVSAEAVDAGEDFDKAARAFEDGAEKPFLTENDRQLLFYQAAMALFRLGSGRHADVKNLLQKSIDAAPESEQVPLLQEMISYIDTLAENQVE